jgi:hypothetical protein
MSLRPAVAVSGALLIAGGAAGCGPGGLPRTSANIAICRVLARVVENKAIIADLAGLAFESNAPVSHRLRQDIGNYIASAADDPATLDTHQAAVTAEADCASIDAPVAPGYS